jgi:LacI family transcriptional regulator
VAISSVSRVFNNHPDVSPQMRQRVLAAAELLGYQPDLIAKSLRSGLTSSAGFVVRDISNPLFADIAKGAEGVLRRSGYSMVLTNSEGNPDLDARYISLFRQRRIDALILALASETYPATLEALKYFPGPLVFVDREVAALPASAVLCDHYSGVCNAVTHILDLGHRRVGLVAGPTTIRVTRERLRGYLDAHHSRDVPIRDDLIQLGTYTKDYGYQQTLALLDSPGAPTALLAAGVQLAFGVMLALHERGLKVGRDIAFVTCDETDLMRVFDPPISAVTRDATMIGEKAAGLLLDMLVKSAPPRVEMIRTQYIARGTTIPPVRDT